MIRAVRQGENRYAVFDAEENIGFVSAYRNPFHNRHFYLNLELTRYDPHMAAELFGLLRQELAAPLQVMLYASRTMHDFLTAGGFERRRRCYELEARPSDLAAPLQDAAPLTRVSQGTAEYDRCCKMLYEYYGKTHRSVSPLTADAETFSAGLPHTAFCRSEEGNIVHFAFVQPNDGDYEIAYVGTTRPADFKAFAQLLVAELFRERGLITAECDDVDPAAMALKSLFTLPDGTPFDTYVLDVVR